MGLDVYVGPLTRYYSGNWELITQQAARAAGMEFHIVRPDGATTEPLADADIAPVRQAILEWRAALRDGSGNAMTGLDWIDLPQADYWTDKPDWDGYWAVRLLAGREEFPAVTPPADVPQPSGLEAVLGGPLATRVIDVYQVKRGGLRGLLGRGSKGVTGDRYPHLHLPELWLPGPRFAPFQGRDVAGNEMVIGSVDALRSELEALNDRTFRADAAQVDDWARAGSPAGRVMQIGEDGTPVDEAGAPIDWDAPEPPADRSLDRVAQFGLAVFLTGARYAASNRLPMKLDY